jgi:hypothetical protein
MLRVFLIGFSLGVLMCAPIGPIGVICARRTIIHGRIAGLVSVLGASTADGLYCALAGLGTTWFSKFSLRENRHSGCFGRRLHSIRLIIFTRKSQHAQPRSGYKPQTHIHLLFY